MDTAEESNRPGTPLQLDQPSLRLQDLDGRIHVYEGPLSRKVKRAKLTSHKKKRWFSINPDHRSRLIFHLTQSKSTQCKRTGLQKILLSLHKANSNVVVKSLPPLQGSTSITGFTIHDSTPEETLLETFYTDDIVQQRNFMAALGGSGLGIFTNVPQASESAADIIDGGDFNHSLLDRQAAYDSGHSKEVSCGCLPAYGSIMEHFPSEFYQFGKTEGCQDTNNSFVSSCTSRGERYSYTVLKPCRNLFLPPHGPARENLVSIGYGKEVGLASCHHQAIWDSQLDCYYFVDHSAQAVFFKDPRLIPTAKKENLKREEFFCKGNCRKDLLEPYNLHQGSGVIEIAAKRAVKRTSRFVVRCCGSSGSCGAVGEKGELGLEGANGLTGMAEDGECGEDGSPGKKGERGRDGESGSAGSNVVIDLSGDSSKLLLCINGQTSKTVNFRGNEEGVVLVDCRGGDGGDGGCGGEGGAGGSGGDGGRGGVSSKGGHGGDGGCGGDGGSGGDGGHAGSGGSCVFRTVDASLLMLVEVDCTSGVPGKGGLGGAGGKGGARGIGGGAGTKKSSDSSKSSGGDTSMRAGMRGKPGSSGNTGYSGAEGVGGALGEQGGLAWVVEDHSGKVIHQSGYRYDAVVTSVTVSPPTCGKSYEPNESVTVSEVVVSNHGGLPLPKGTQLTFPSNETVRFEPQVYSIPEIACGESLTLPVSFNGRIFDQSSPNNPGHFVGEAWFTPSLKLSGRPFTNTLTQSLVVSYPVKLIYALSKRNMGVGEESILEVGLENMSSLMFGKTEGSSGSMAILIHLDTFLVPVGVTCGADERRPQLKVDFDPNKPNSLLINMFELLPHETTTFKITFKINENAKLCDSCIWQVDLLYKGKLIEYMSQEIRITPSYSLSPTPSSTTNPELGDVLMVTNKNTSAAEFTLWQKIFDTLELNVDYWDTEWDPDEPMPLETSREGAANSLFFGNLHREVPDTRTSDFPSLFAMYSGKTIVYPHCNLEDISAEDIVAHFNSSPTNDSSLLLFLKPTFPKSFEDHYYDHADHTAIFRHLCRAHDKVKIPEGVNIGYHLVAPGTFVSADASIKKCERRVLKKLEKENQPNALAMFSRSNHIRHKSTVKYSYGSMDVRRCPIKRSSNFQCVSGMGGTMVSMGSDDPLFTPNSREFPLASRFGQVLLAVLASAVLESKLRILKNSSGSDHDQNGVKCYLPTGAFLTVKELTAICIAHDVADEILDGGGGSISRMKRVKDDIIENRLLYSRNGTAAIIDHMLLLIEEEARARVEICDNLPACLCAAKKIAKMCWSLRATGARDEHATPHQQGSHHNVARMNSAPVSNHHHNDHASSAAIRSQSCSAVSTQEGMAISYQHRGMWSQESSHCGSGCLLPLKILQDSVHVLRTHQLTVEDNCYNASRTVWQ